MEGSGSSETVHDSQANPFGREYLAENHFHLFLIQPSQDIKEPVGGFIGSGG